MSNLNIRITDKKNSVAYSKLVQAFLLGAGFDNHDIAGKPKTVTNLERPFILVDPENKQYVTLNGLSSMATEVINIPAQLVELEAKLTVKPAGPVELFHEDTEYKVSVQPNGVVQFGCTVVRPSVVKAFIELRKKAVAGLVKHSSSASGEFPVLEIQSDYSELLYAVDRYLDNNRDDVFEDEDHPFEEGDLTGINSLYIYTKYDADEQDHVCCIVAEELDNAKPALKKNTLVLPRDWAKLNTAIDAFKDADYVDAKAREGIDLSQDPASIKVGEYYVTCDKTGGIYISEGANVDPEEEGQLIESKFVDQVLTAWGNTTGAKDILKK